MPVSSRSASWSCCRAAAGTWSTHVVAVAAQLQPLPNEADPLQLSMMTINPPTAALLLSEFVSLGPGEWVIQNAANSAVGLYLVQLARYRGYRTVNVVRREDAAEVVRETGGDVVLVDGEDLAQRVVAATDGSRRSGSASMRWRGRHRTPRRLPVRERDAGQLRPHERRAVCGATGRLRLPRPDAARLLARETGFGARPRSERRAIVGEIAGLITRQASCTRRSTPPTTSARSRTRWRPRRAAGDRARSSSCHASLLAQGAVFSAQSPSGCVPPRPLIVSKRSVLRPDDRRRAGAGYHLYRRKHQRRSRCSGRQESRKSPIARRDAASASEQQSAPGRISVLLRTTSGSGKRPVDRVRCLGTTSAAGGATGPTSNARSRR